MVKITVLNLVGYKIEIEAEPSEDIEIKQKILDK